MAESDDDPDGDECPFLFYFFKKTEYHLRTALRFGWREIVVYVCRAFIWT